MPDLQPRETPWGPTQMLAIGVRGIVKHVGDSTITIRWIEAVDEGRGAVGRYLDSLPRDQTVYVEEVLNPRLAGMLSRRGFTRAFDSDDWFRIPERPTRVSGDHRGIHHG